VVPPLVGDTRPLNQIYVWSLETTDVLVEGTGQRWCNGLYSVVGQSPLVLQHQLPSKAASRIQFSADGTVAELVCQVEKKQRSRPQPKSMPMFRAPVRYERTVPTSSWKPMKGVKPSRVSVKLGGRCETGASPPRSLPLTLVVCTSLCDVALLQIA